MFRVHGLGGAGGAGVSIQSGAFGGESLYFLEFPK